MESVERELTRAWIRMSKQRDHDGILKSACENFEIFRKAGDMDRAAGCLRILSMTADKILSTLAPPEPVQTERARIFPARSADDPGRRPAWQPGRMSTFASVAWPI